MLTTKQAIEQRRSIRRFKSEPVPDDIIMSLLEAARLALSGSNAQFWRFKVVKDKETKFKLSQAAYNQLFIADAPIVLVCCADIKGYLDVTASGIQDLGKIGAIEDRIMNIILDRVNNMNAANIEPLGDRIALHVAVAVEHIVLRALDFGMRSCWIRLVNEQMIKDIFGWDNNISVVALLPIGYPAE